MKDKISSANGSVCGLMVLLASLSSCTKKSTSEIVAVTPSPSPSPLVSVTKSYLFVVMYDSGHLTTQKLVTYSVDRVTGALTYVSSVSDLSNAQNPVVLNNTLYVASRGESKIRVFSIDPATGILTDKTSDSGTAVTGMLVLSHLAVDVASSRLFATYVTGGGIGKVRMLQSDEDTGVLTNINSTADSSSGVTGIASAVAVAQDLSQLFVITDTPSVGAGTLDSSVGTYSSLGTGGTIAHAFFAYPGTSFLIVGMSTPSRVKTFTLPFASLAALASPTQTLMTAAAFGFAKHPSLDVLYATQSVGGIQAYGVNVTTGALTLKNDAGGNTGVVNPDADEGIAVLSTGKFVFASHGITGGGAIPRIDTYPVNSTTGEFEDGVTETDLTSLSAGYPRFLTTADFVITE